MWHWVLILYDSANAINYLKHYNNATSLSNRQLHFVRRLIIWRKKAMNSSFGVAEPNRINSRPIA